MTVINIHSIKDALTRGTLLELSTDYRTSTTVRSILPSETPCAITPAAFGQHVRPGPARGAELGVETIGVFLRSTLGLGGGSSPAAETKFLGTSWSDQLKLEWYAPDKRWVILLPHEQLQPVAKLT